MTNSVLDAYVEYLEYPTLVVNHEKHGFESLEAFIGEGVRLKEETDDLMKNRNSWFEDMPFLIRDDAVDAISFSNEYLGTWDEQNFEGTINFDTPLSADVITSNRIANGTIRSTQIITDEIITDEISPSTAIQYYIYGQHPFNFPPIEPPDTPCYRKYLNIIREKEVANKFIIRADAFYHSIIANVNLKRKFSMYKIRDPTSSLMK